jgi:protein-S-isoprenylcysteine O-methyltransferase Ste14
MHTHAPAHMLANMPNICCVVLCCAGVLPVLLQEMASRFVPRPLERLLAVVTALLHRCVCCVPWYLGDRGEACNRGRGPG